MTFTYLGTEAEEKAEPTTFTYLGVEEQEERPFKAAGRAATVSGLGTFGDIAEAIGLGTSNELLPGQKARLQAEREAPDYLKPFFQEEDIAPEYSRLPTSKDIDELLTMLGIKKEERTPLEKGAGRFGRLAGSSAAIPIGGVTGSLTTAGLGAVGGQLAEQAGAGETGQAIAEIAAPFGPSLIKGAKNLLTRQAVKTPSGLSKLPATETKHAKRATISGARKESAITKINEEASKLAKEEVHKKLPIAKQIEEGFDFDKKFQEGFSNIQKMAKKANPVIETKAVDKLLGEQLDKYRGVPELHSDAKKVVKEVQAFRRKPVNDLYSALKTFRSNNQKLKSIYEKSRLHGSQKEYADFLLDYNRAITKSLEDTFPKNSPFVNEFKKLNKDFSEYKSALSTMQTLEPIIGGKPSMANLNKIAANPKVYQRLENTMGTESAKQIKQIADDLKDAHQAIKKIPVKEFSKWDAIYPLSHFIPDMPGSEYLKATSYLLTAKKLGSSVLGYYLTSPKKRLAYQNALKAIKDNDINKYKQAVTVLSKTVNESEE